jgi:hypothetical protein
VDEAENRLHTEKASRADRALMGRFEDRSRCARHLRRSSRKTRNVAVVVEDHNPEGPTSTGCSTIPCTACTDRDLQASLEDFGDPPFRARDQDHCPPRARALPGIDEARLDARLREHGLEAIMIASAVVGAVVVVLFFVGPGKEQGRPG